jgi:hypothetical protein
VLAAAAALTVLLAGCGGDEAEGGAGPDASSSGGGQVGVDASGVYDTRVTLSRSTCDGIEVRDEPTTVEQDAGVLSLTHAALVLTGTLAPDGAFTTETTEVEVGPDTHALTATGVLADGHLSAEVTADVTGSRSCRYTVTWDGVRS